MGDGMRTAHFVSRLIVEEVRDLSSVRYYEHVMPEFPIVATDGAVLDIEHAVTEHIAPVYHICRTGRQDLYVAYSKQVEELLGIPIRLLVEEKESARGETRRLQERLWMVAGLSFWLRLKFLFTKRLPA